MAVATVPPNTVPARTEGRVARHLNALAILWAIYGVLHLIPAFIMAGLAFAERHGFGPPPPPPPPGFPLEPRVFAHMIFYGIALLMLVFAVPALAAGWGLFKRRHWGRSAVIIAAIIAIFNIPFGTALAIYTLWVMMGQSSEREYRQIAPAY